MSNIRFLNETTATGVNSVSVTDVFTSDFDIYKIIVYDIDQSSTGGSHNNICFINSNGSQVTSAIYDYAQSQIKTYSSFGTDKYFNQSYMRLMGQITGGSDVAGGAVLYIFNPTNSSAYTFAIGQSSAYYDSAGGLGSKAIGVLKETSSITGINFKTNTTSTTYDNFKFRIYGMRVDT